MVNAVREGKLKKTKKKKRAKTEQRGDELKKKDFGHSRKTLVALGTAEEKIFLQMCYPEPSKWKNHDELLVVKASLTPGKAHVVGLVSVCTFFGPLSHSLCSLAL